MNYIRRYCSSVPYMARQVQLFAFLSCETSPKLTSRLGEDEAFQRIRSGPSLFNIQNSKLATSDRPAPLDTVPCTFPFLHTENALVLRL